MTAYETLTQVIGKLSSDRWSNGADLIDHGDDFDDFIEVMSRLEKEGLIDVKREDGAYSYRLKSKSVMFGTKLGMAISRIMDTVSK